MRGSAFILIGLVAMAVSTALAAPLCANVFENAPPALDPHYMHSMSHWGHSWEGNMRLKLTGATPPALPQEVGFAVDDFLKAREFRTWFEAENRMAKRFDQAAGPVTSQARLLADGKDALAAKIVAIRQAKHTIDMTYYIIGNDAASLALMGELKAAVRRGVSIRLMFDSMGSKEIRSDNPMLALVEWAKTNGGFALGFDGKPSNVRAKVELVEFQPVGATVSNLFRAMFRNVQNMVLNLFGQDAVDPVAGSFNRRSHDKILLIDADFEQDAIAFMGGRNLRDRYYGDPRIDDHAVDDLEVVMKGLTRDQIGDGLSMGAQVQQYFDQVYFHLGNRLVTRSLLQLVFGHKDTWVDQMDAAQANLSQELGLDGDQDELRRLLLEDGVADHKIEIIDTFHNIFRDKASRKIEIADHRLSVKNSRALMAATEKAIAKEQSEVTIISPYLWLSERQIRLLKNWLLQDPARKLVLVTNSIMTNNHALTQVLTDSVLGPELMMDQGLSDENGNVLRRSIADQVRIYEYGHTDAVALGGNQAYGLLHTKAVYLKSTQTSIIGSFNNDPRSLVLNSEGAAIVQGPQVAVQTEKSIQDLIRRCHLWGGDEYRAIRSDPHLSKNQRMYAQKMQMMYDLMIRLRLWWLI